MSDDGWVSANDWCDAHSKQAEDALYPHGDSTRPGRLVYLTYLMEQEFTRGSEADE